VLLDDLRKLTGHFSPQMTQICDRRQRKALRNLIEQIYIHLTI